MWERLNEGARRALLIAQREAAQGCYPEVLPAHMLLGMAETELQEPGEPFGMLLAQNGLNAEMIRFYAQSVVPTMGQVDGAVPLPKIGPALERLLHIASYKAWRMNRFDVGQEHIFLALLLDDVTPLRPVLQALNFDLKLTTRMVERLGQRAGRPVGHPLENLNEDATAVLVEAQRLMKQAFCGRVSTLHLLEAVLREPSQLGVATALMHGYEPEELLGRVKLVSTSDQVLAGPETRYTPAAQLALNRAMGQASLYQRRWIGVDHIFMGLLPIGLSLRERLRRRLMSRSIPEDPGGDILLRRSRY